MVVNWLAKKLNSGHIYFNEMNFMGKAIENVAITDIQINNLWQPIEH